MRGDRSSDGAPARLRLTPRHHAQHGGAVEHQSTASPTSAQPPQNDLARTDTFSFRLLLASAQGPGRS